MGKLTLMLTAGLVVTAGFAAALGSASRGESSGRPALRLIDRSPVTVQGRHFRSAERVKVTMYTEKTSVRVTASRAGAFTASLPVAEIDRCDRIVIRAVGTAGSTAQLKLLPRPACRAT
jgi:hypothetical protein